MNSLVIFNSKAPTMIPGEILPKSGEIILNKNATAIQILVANAGDRPIQIGSHYHFFEVNKALKFDRETTYGMRLNIAAGTAIRFEPGQTREVILIPFTGERNVFGFAGDIMGKLKP